MGRTVSPANTEEQKRSLMAGLLLHESHLNKIFSIDHHYPNLYLKARRPRRICSRIS